MTALKILFCALWYFRYALTSNPDIIQVSYIGNAIENDIVATEAPLSDCQKEHTKWDKLFTMLENSQMKQNMLLQSVDDIISVELQSVRAEILQFVSTFATTCANNLERSKSQIISQMEKTLATSSEQSKLSETADKSKQGKLLEAILLISSKIASRLDNLEADCQRKSEVELQQTDSLKEIKTHLSKEGTLKSLLRELQQTRFALQRSHSRMPPRLLPADCEMVILFPSRSPWIYASVHPAIESTLHDFTACIWVKVTDVLDKTIVFSYGTKRNPYEMQFYLSHQSAVFIVGTDENKLVAENVTSPEAWTHFCSAWSSKDGIALIWVNGELKASSAEIAQGYIIPDKGILQLGQEKNGCCVGGGFDETLSFSGKMTVFNVWDRVLSEEEIITQTDGKESCNFQGNVVGWGVTQIQPHGGAQYIY